MGSVWNCSHLYLTQEILICIRSKAEPYSTKRSPSDYLRTSTVKFASVIVLTKSHLPKSHVGTSGVQSLHYWTSKSSLPDLLDPTAQRKSLFKTITKGKNNLRKNTKKKRKTFFYHPNDGWTEKGAEKNDTTIEVQKVGPQKGLLKAKHPKLCLQAKCLDFLQKRLGVNKRRVSRGK